MHFYIVNACTPHIFILVFLILFEDKYKFNFSGIVWVLLLMLICNITVMYQGREFLRVRALVEWFLPWEKFEYKLKIIWKTCWEIERENKGAEKVNSNGCAVMKRTRAKLVEMSMGSRKREKREIFYVAKVKKKAMRFQSPQVNWRESWLYLAREGSLWAVYLDRSWQAEVEITVSEEIEVNRINSHLGRKKYLRTKRI